jgi:hypothetical protein
MDMTAPFVSLSPTSVAVDQMPSVVILTSDAKRAPLSLLNRNPEYPPGVLGGVAFNTIYGILTGATTASAFKGATVVEGTQIDMLLAGLLDQVTLFDGRTQVNSKSLPVIVEKLSGGGKLPLNMSVPFTALTKPRSTPMMLEIVMLGARQMTRESNIVAGPE